MIEKIRFFFAIVMILFSFSVSPLTDPILDKYDVVKRKYDVIKIKILHHKIKILHHRQFFFLKWR